jgi:hypothetical protein
MKYYAAIPISSASEFFAGICGYWRHHMKPTVFILGIHLLAQRIVVTSGRADAMQKVDVPSPLERYLGRPRDSGFHHLTYLDYHFRYSVDGHSTSSDVHRDVHEPVRFANSRKELVLCIANTVRPRNHELFELRLLLRRFAAGTWEELRTCNGEPCHSFYYAAQQHRLLSNVTQRDVLSFIETNFQKCLRYQWMASF